MIGTAQLGGWVKCGYGMPVAGIGSIGASAPVAGTQQGDAALIGSNLMTVAGALARNPATAIAAPFVAVAGALANIVSLFGPNPNNTYATEVVNQVEADVLQPNLSAWQALATADKTLVNQAAAVAVFNGGWGYVLSACNNPALGSAGINCLKDRQRGGKFDWFKLYLDPIQTDPAPAANAALAAEAAATSTTTTTNPDGTTTTTPTSTGTITSSNLFLYGGLGLLGLALMIGAMD
jgi:hypothetical protein